MLDKLRRLNTDTVTLEELVEMSAFARALKAEYDRHNIPTPDWVDDKARLVSREINMKVADDRSRRAREIKAQLTGLESASEKRARLQAELATLEPEPMAPPAPASIG